jgi:uncharacterized membrane protein YeiB
MIYALLGVIVLACTGFAQRTVGIIVLAMAGVVALMALVLGALTGLGMMLEAAATGATVAASDGVAQRGFAAMVAADFNPDAPVWIEAERAAFQEGPFADALLFRCVLYAFGFIAGVFSYGWQSLFMMLCGVYAFKAGLFAPEGSALRRKVALPALLLGVVVAASGVLAPIVFGFDSAGASATHTALVALGAMVLPFAYAAIIIEWGPRLPAFLATPLERTGRMSFTVYLSESLICTALASWWGLAWFGTIDDAQAALIAVCVWLALVVFATAWLSVFRIGPFEWFWRVATYGRGGGRNTIQTAA